MIRHITDYILCQTFRSVDETLACATIHVKANEHCFHVVLFVMLYKVVQTFKSMDGTLETQCHHSCES